MQIRVLTAGLILLVAGCTLFWFGSHQHQAATRPTTYGFLGQSRSGSRILPKFADGKELTAGELSSKAPLLLAGLPLYFEPNQGQGTLDPADSRAKFISRGAGYSLFLGSDGAILSLSHQSQKRASAATKTPSAPSLEYLQMKLVGSNPQANLSATNLLPGKSDYFIGNDASKWRTAIPHFARVRYENVYPGINLVFYGSEGRLEYDFQVAPGSDPAQAELEFNGARKLELKDGALIIHAGHGSVALQAPRVYQETAGKQQPIEASFVLRSNNRAGFAIAPYDHSRELIIDPVLNFSTYFGGTGDELNNFVAVDSNLNIYLAGSTTSASLPGITAASLQQTLKGPQNVYIAKITPPLGSIAATLDNVTYLGGNGTDAPVGIQVDGGDNPYLAGTTSSTDFPTTTTNAYQPTIYSGSTGTTHVFVTRIKSDFTALQYSSYLSGNGTDTASGMTIDAAGNLYVTGTTTSSNAASNAIQFPASTVPNMLAFQQVPFAATQFFVTKVNTTHTGITSVAYSTYFGGAPPTGSTSLIAIGGGITVDANQNVYFTGTTNFTYSGTAIGAGDFPIQNAYQPCLNSPPAAVVLPPQSCGTAPDPTLPDAFASKLSTTTVSPPQQLVWSTYLGGTGTDSGAGIALDSGAANVYVVGTTNSQDFVNTAFVSTFASFQRCLNNEPPTPSTGVVTCTTQTNPPNDAFVARITNPTITQGSTTTVALNYFSYLGGSGTESGNAITVDSNSGAVITGSTTSPFTTTTTPGTFPLNPSPSSIQSQLTEAQAAFIARLNTAAVTGQTTTASWATYFGGNCNPQAVPPCTPPDPFVSSGTGIALDVNQDTYVSGDTNSPYLLVAKPLTQGTTLSGGYDAFVTQLGTAVSISISGVLGLGTNQSFIAAGNPVTFTYTITNSGPDLATNITILADLNATGIPLTNVTGSISTGTCGAGTTGTGISCGPISLQSGSTATLTITATPTATSGGASPISFNGGTIIALAPGNFVLAQTSVPATMSDFKMNVSPLNQSVPQAGATATYSVSLTPQPLFGSPITLSCTGAPANSTCTFSPSSSVTFQSSTGLTPTMSIATTARPITPTASLFNRQFYALWVAIPCIAILGIGGDRRRRKMVGISMLCMICALLLLVPGCNHSTTQTPSSGTPAGSYPITITASSGTNSKSQTVTLNVP